MYYKQFLNQLKELKIKADEIFDIIKNGYGSIKDPETVRSVAYEFAIFIENILSEEFRKMRVRWIMDPNNKDNYLEVIREFLGFEVIVARKQYKWLAILPKDAKDWDSFDREVIRIIELVGKRLKEIDTSLQFYATDRIVFEMRF